MNDFMTQKHWMQLSRELCCADCKALRLLIWEKEKHSELPQHAKPLDTFLYAVHCDYFKRRIEHPDKLQRCGAHQSKDSN